MSEYLVNKGQIAKIHVLLAKVPGLDKEGKDELKRGLVAQYSEGRATSTKELTWKEAQDVISALDNGRSVQDDRGAEDRKRKRLLAIAHNMGWQTDTGKVDVARVSSWAEKYGSFKKPLMEHTSTELSKLIVQFEAVYKSFLRSV